MDVRGVGAGPPNADFTSGPSIRDAVSALLQSLSEAQQAALFNMMGRPGDGQNAVALLAALSPERAAELVSLPAFAAIRGDLEILLSQARIAATPATCFNQAMDVRGIGTGPPSGGAPSISDTVSALLQNLSEAQQTAILTIIGHPNLPQQEARLDTLLQAAVAAVSEGDKKGAVTLLAEYAALSPERAEELPASPALAPIRGAVESLLSRLTTTARMDAEGRLAQAVTLMETPDAPERIAGEVKPEVLIAMAGRLLDAGGFANAVRSAELSQLLLNPAAWAPSLVPTPPEVKEARRASEKRAVAPGGGFFTRLQLGLQTRRLWQRAPLLVLLLAWLSLGVAGGVIAALTRSYWPETFPSSLVSVGFEIWAVGFLLLIGLGFYARVRNVRF